jgi:hypothetical protein
MTPEKQIEIFEKIYNILYFLGQHVQPLTEIQDLKELIKEAKKEI